MSILYLKILENRSKRHHLVFLLIILQKVTSMNKKILSFLSVLSFSLLSTNALAFECPKHLKAAQDKIDKVMADMVGMADMMDKGNMALVHSLIDDAKMYLVSAEHNHSKPQGPYDHGRSIAKANAAFGYANGAEIMHWKMMKDMGKMK